MKHFLKLFTKELKDIYDAENQIVEYLPDLIQTATSSELKEALQHHLKETKKQVERLEKIARQLDIDLTGPESSALNALLKETDKIATADYDDMTRDAALILAAQRVEHYEIATYGALKAFAKHLKLNDVEELLEETAEEEGKADKILTKIAQGTLFHRGVNEKAMKRCG